MVSASRSVCCSDAAPPLREPALAAEPAQESAPASSVAPAVCCSGSVFRRRPAVHSAASLLGRRPAL
eukprot:6308563-Alexandrium_andersonii.AAC.1